MAFRVIRETEDSKTSLTIKWYIVDAETGAPINEDDLVKTDRMAYASDKSLEDAMNTLAESLDSWRKWR